MHLEAAEAPRLLAAPGCRGRTAVSIITLTTDFGPESIYAAAMKGVILSINPQATIIDITHSIPRHNIAAGAMALDDVAERFPPQTIHVAVVDPGVGTDRALIYAEIGGQRFLAPDNGLLTRIAARRPVQRVIRLTEREHWLPEVSNTFHGRDILAPVAARLSLGLDPAELGPPFPDLTRLPERPARVRPNRIDGEVIAIDSFGNVLTNITADMLAGRPTDARACVVCGIFETWGIFPCYAAQEPGMLVALIDSQRRLELALVGDNAAARLGIHVGMPVTIAWNQPG